MTAAIERKGTQRVCPQCGEEFLALQEHRGFKRKYCSPPCAGRAAQEKAAKTYPPREEIVRLYWDEGMSDKAVGRHFGHSHQWSLKVRRYYDIPGHPDGHNRRKPLAQGRDRARWGVHLKHELMCRNCGRPAGRKALALHHAIPRSMHSASKYDLRNGLPLCGRCHIGWHKRRVTIYRDVFTPEEWAYISTVELLGQNIEAWLDDRYPERVTT